jgi:hypothetical protein
VARPAGRSGRAPRAIVAILYTLAAAATLAGLPYYGLPPAERVRHVLHPQLRPAGPLGLAFGVLGLSLFLFLWLYPLRKRWKWLGFTGSVGRWLDVHIACGLSVPFVVAVHAGWRFDGLIGLGYAAILLVCFSGILGRYLYLWIPRSRSGIELTLDEVASQRRALITEVAVATGLDPFAVERALAGGTQAEAGGGFARAIGAMLAADFTRWRALRALRRAWAAPRPGTRAPDRRALKSALRLARREILLSQQVRMLDASRRVFAYWHAAHRPVALVALIAVLVHVGIAVAVGAVGFH